MGIFDDGKCGQNIFGAFDNETKKTPENWAS